MFLAFDLKINQSMPNLDLDSNLLVVQNVNIKNEKIWGILKYNNYI